MTLTSEITRENIMMRINHETTDLSTKRFIAKFADDNNMERIGKGSFAEVFSSPSLRHVVKIGKLPYEDLEDIEDIEEDVPFSLKGNIAYFIYITQYASLYKDNPFLPKVYNVTVYTNHKRKEKFFVIEIEKLESVKGRGGVKEWCKSFIRLFGHTHGVDLHRLELFLTQVDEKLRRHFEDLTLCLEALLDDGAYPMCLDIHDENIMVRDDGQIVITDPVI
jgi:hypothetical protein